MKDVSYEEGKWYQENCLCGECKSQLVCYWGGAYGIDGYIVRCAKDINHDQIARPARLSPYSIPGFNLFNLKRRKEMEKELGKEKTKKLIKYEGFVTLTQAGAMEILQTIWPEAPEVEVMKAAMVCHHYGLNPLMKHVFLIPFKRRQKGMVVGEDWVTVLGIKATRLIAHRSGDFSYLDNTPRVMTDDEQTHIFGEVDKDKIWAITTLRDGKGNIAPGYGCWPKEEIPYGTEKGNTKANMAFIRSERNAMERLFPGEMPQGVEVIDEQYIEAEYSLKEAPKGDEKDVAEVAEKQGEEGKAGAKTFSSPKDEAKSQKIGASAARDPHTIINFGDLFQALWDDFHLSKSESLHELNVSTQSEITELPSECYIKISAVR